MTRRRKKIDVSDTELSILEVLWKDGPTTIRQVMDRLYPKSKRTTAAYATMQKLLDRLETKNCVSRDRSLFAHRFRARVKRSELIDQRLKEVADKLCEGSLTPLLIHLAGQAQLSEEERETLRKMMDDA
ncbi:MAG TPA: BlaI/MecI/CopY family transcriptional regulator [Planctomycetaceae bacterium]|nr:BlaI/MecI/CopY family transcriptional regulator [Planctomycetaceae bacterium]